MAELAGHRLITQSPASPQVRAGADFVQRLLGGGAVLVAHGEQLFRHPAGGDPRARHRIAADYLTGDFPDLVNILPEEQSAPIPAYLAYVEELRHSKRVCAFRDFMLEEITAFKRGELAEAEARPSHAVAR